MRSISGWPQMKPTTATDSVYSALSHLQWAVTKVGDIVAASYSCCILFPHLDSDYNMVNAKEEPMAESAATLLLP